MKKRIFCLILAILMLVPCGFLSISCKDKDPDKDITNENNNNNTQSIFKSVIEAIENDIKDSVTIKIDSNNRYGIDLINDGQISEDSNQFTDKVFNYNATIKTQNGNISINDSMNTECYIAKNGMIYSYDKDNQTWSLSYDPDTPKTIVNIGKELKSDNIKKAMGKFKNLAERFGKCTITTQEVDNVTTINIKCDMTERFNNLFNIMIKDIDKPIETLINDILSEVAGKEVNILAELKKYTDKIDENTTIDDLLDEIKNNSGIDIEECLDDIIDILDKINVYSSVNTEYSFYSGYISLYKLNTLKNNLKIENADSIKKIKISELLGQTTYLKENATITDISSTNETNNNDQIKLGDALYNYVEKYIKAEMTLNSMFDNDTKSMIESIKNGKISDISITTDIIMTSNHIISMDIKCSAVLGVLNGSVSGMNYRANSDTSIKFEEFGNTTVTKKDITAISHAEITIHTTAKDNNDDIVIDLSMYEPFSKDFEIKVMYNNNDIEENPTKVAFYDKSTKKLTILKSFYNNAIDAKYDFNTMDISYNDFSENATFYANIRIIFDNLIK